MSQVAIRAALETALAAITPALATAWENVPFSPPDTDPYQCVYVRFSAPDNPEFGARYWERGYMQVTLVYPPSVGDKTARTRAMLVRAAFPRGRTISSGGIDARISDTPEVRGGAVENNLWTVNVFIHFESQIEA